MHYRNVINLHPLERGPAPDSLSVAEARAVRDVTYLVRRRAELAGKPLSRAALDEVRRAASWDAKFRLDEVAAFIAKLREELPAEPVERWRVCGPGLFQHDGRSYVAGDVVELRRFDAFPHIGIVLESASSQKGSGAA